MLLLSTRLGWFNWPSQVLILAVGCLCSPTVREQKHLGVIPLPYLQSINSD